MTITRSLPANQGLLGGKNIKAQLTFVQFFLQSSPSFPDLHQHFIQYCPDVKFYEVSCPVDVKEHVK